jgi:DNA-binding beta-propeller fold protein YncE
VATSEFIPTNESTLSVIDGVSNEVVATIAYPNADPGMHIPNVAVNPTTNRVYASFYNQDINTFSHYYVLVLDGATNAVLDTIPVALHRIEGMAVNATTNRLYVAQPTVGSTQDLSDAWVFPGLFLGGHRRPRGLCDRRRHEHGDRYGPCGYVPV